MTLEEHRGRMSTRAGNKFRRPGLVDRSSSAEGDGTAAPPTKKRRTSSEAALHRQQQEAAKQAKVADAKQMAQKKVDTASLEDRIAIEAESRKRHAARPPLSEIMTKVTRPVAELVADAQASVRRVELAAGPLPELHGIPFVYSIFSLLNLVSAKEMCLKVRLLIGQCWTIQQTTSTTEIMKTMKITCRTQPL